MTITLERTTTGDAGAGGGGAVVATGLTKRYGRRAAVDDLSFSIPRGAMAGLIGPNGAGKTTLMAMLLGLVRPSGGTASVLGHPIATPAAYLSRVGSLIEGPAFHPGVSGLVNLRALAILGGHDPDQAPALLDTVGLAGRGDDRYGSYSFGMKQRLGIAAALLGDPELVVLDEPTNGLDPVGIQEMRELIRAIAAADRSVLVSSHLLSELEHVCDWLVVLDHGGRVYEGPPAGLGGTAATLVVRAPSTGAGELLALLARAGWAGRADGDAVRLPLDAGTADPHDEAAAVNRLAHAAGIVLGELHVERAGLESRYLDLIGGAR